MNSPQTTQLIGGIPMSYPIMPAAGVCKYVAQLDQYQDPGLPIGVDIIGSILFEQRQPNQPDPLFWPNDWSEFERLKIGFNSFGMPEDGIDHTLEALGLMKLARPCVMSLAAFQAADYVTLVPLACQSLQVAGVELNLGCPNTGKTPFAYDYEATREILEGLRKRWGKFPPKPIWLKLSPYITGTELCTLKAAHPDIDFDAVPTTPYRFAASMMQLIKQYPFVQAVVWSNTLPNCRYIDPGTQQPVTGPYEGRAGLSGPILWDISRRCIEEAASVQDSIGGPDLIHAGGNISGDTVAKALTFADAVQCASGPFWYGDGPRFFANLGESEALQRELIRRGLLESNY
ncbi:MAG: hypothetical protein KBD27_01295 [Candidatus Moranbacteria bacterium]|nr:hypothetical protein [Candidatus Moranbacteria bacterium]